MTLFSIITLHSLALFLSLTGLCAAASAAVVELLPLVHIVELQSVMSLLFPTGAALLASAAAVSKARCEVDSKAAGSAAAMVTLPCLFLIYLVLHSLFVVFLNLLLLPHFHISCCTS